MTHRLLRTLAGAFLPLALLAGCAPQATPDTAATSASAPASTTRTITDQAGNTIEIPAKVERVGATIGAFGHITAVVGGADKLVVAIPMLSSGLFHEVWPESNPDRRDPSNVEEVIAGNTQVIYGPRFTDEVTAQLQAAGVVVVTINQFGTPEQMMSVIALVGDILGDGSPAKAKAFNDFYARTIADVERRVADVPDAERVKTLNLRVGGDGYSTVDSLDISSAYVRSAGGIVVSADFDTANSTVGAEQIIAWAPEVIFTMGRAARERILSDPALATVPAVKNGKVYAEPEGTYPWSVRSAEGALMPVFLGTILHPDKFADLSLAEVTKSFYSDFYGYDLSQEQLDAILAGGE